jgi:hypothetical protein
MKPNFIKGDYPFEGYVFHSQDTLSDTYDYLGFIALDGAWMIMRTKKDGTEIRYAVGSGHADVAWTNRTQPSMIYNTIDRI